jgi:CelD/BcsL family acetyltransferase involved in cellulose biosynthesis
VTDARATERFQAGTEAAADVADAWRELAELRGNAFVTPEWFLAWEQQFGSGRREVIVARDDQGTLRGVLPFAPGDGQSSRRLRFAGAPAADHLHPAAAADDEAAVAAAAGALLAEQPGWKVVVLDNADIGAPWTRELASAAGPRVKARAYRDAVLPRLDLSGVGGWDEFLAGRSRNFRSQLGRFERRLDRDHELVFRMAESQDQLGSDLETFFRLHDARWQPRGGSSSEGEPLRAFHADFASGALARGWLRLWFLELDGEPAAAWYGWRVGDRYAFYLSGFEPRFADLRVGLVLLAHTLRSAIAEGASEYDMLLGNEPYKARFANSERTVQSVLVTRPGLASALAAAETGIWRTSRRLPEARRAQLRSAFDGIVRRLPGARHA